MTFVATTQDLTTVARLKEALAIQDSSSTSNDTALQNLVTVASNYFLSLINRKTLYSATYSETRSGNGRDRMMAKFFPVTAVSAVTIGTVSVPVGAVNPPVAGFLFDDTKILLSGGYRFDRGFANVLLNYTAGYPAMASGLPQDYTMLAVERGVIALAATWWKRKARWDENSHSFDGHVTASFSQKDIPPETQTAVRQFQSVAPIGTL